MGKEGVSSYTSITLRAVKITVGSMNVEKDAPE